MIAAGSFVFVSTHIGSQVSSADAIVCGIVGIAILAGGVEARNWNAFGILTLSWIVTPFLAATCSLFVRKLVKLTIYRAEHCNVMKRPCNWVPLYGTIVVTAIKVARSHESRFLKK
jgi:PiT family inorganic phosphate transporter